MVVVSLLPILHGILPILPGEVQTATMVTSVDLSAAFDAEVTFYALIDLEEGFDYMPGCL